jgi:16S rRNA (cytidine1402-2'-O)-methyltransferase
LSADRYGTLYLCATPIGNLGDMTFRAVETLRSVGLIAAEDTRHSRKLTSHFDIHVPLTSYHEHNRYTKGPELVEKLLAGMDIALVSDAGLPGISDPGEALVQLAVEAGVRVVPIPGANAALTALVASGLATDGFLFTGFLPKATTARRAKIRTLQSIPVSLLFYESPHQLLKTLADLQAVLGDRRAVIGRELTKLHEEFRRGQLSELIAWFRENNPRGEFTLVIEGASALASTELAAEAAVTAEFSDTAILQVVNRLIADGTNKKDAIKMTASQLDLPRRRVYQLVVKSI